MTKSEQAVILRAAIQKLQEAADLLEQLGGAPEIDGCLAQLQGMSEGWIDETMGGERLLVDCLVDHLLAAERPEQWQLN